MDPTFYSGYISASQVPEQAYEVARPRIVVEGAGLVTQIACVRETLDPMTPCEAEGYLRETCLPWMFARIVPLTEGRGWMWGVYLAAPSTDVPPAEPRENIYDELRRAQNYVQDIVLSEEVI